LRRDFYASDMGQALLAAVRLQEFRQAVVRLGGYDVSRTGQLKEASKGPRGQGVAPHSASSQR
jgi:hypothetical protein